MSSEKFNLQKNFALALLAFAAYKYLTKPKFIEKTSWKETPEPVLEEPTEKDIKSAIDKLRQNFQKKGTNKVSGPGWNLEWRLKNLRALYTFVLENSDEILEAGKKDLGKTKSEWFLEKQAILSDLREAITGLPGWMKCEQRSTPLWMTPSSSYIVHEPYGVTLVLSPWNYPMALSLLPLAAGIAAGNAVVLKPSELSPAQAKLLQEKLPKYLDPECFRLVLGGPTTAKNLVESDFDFVFFTGSTKTGTLVAQACAKRLIPNALELGGKSPTIVDETCDLTVTCRRICQAKFANASQTCIACDYIIVIGDEQRKKQVMQALDKEIKFQFGDDVQKSKTFARIVNDIHFKRICNLIPNGKVIRGGKTDQADKYIEPTILEVDSSNETPLMTEEIFGPLLPVFNVPKIEDAIHYIQARPKPLALYIFSSNSKNVDLVLAKTTSGSACVNEAVFQYLNPYLPFGGVGASGVGSNHGKAGFLEFSHSKSVLARGTLTDIYLRYLPYIDEEWVQNVFGWAMSL